jgi:hypothetical protein
MTAPPSSIGERWSEPVTVFDPSRAEQMIVAAEGDVVEMDGGALTLEGRTVKITGLAASPD